MLLLLLQLSLPEKAMFLRHSRSLQKSAKLSAKVLIEICNQSGKKLAPEDIFLSSFSSKWDCAKAWKPRKS